MRVTWRSQPLLVLLGVFCVVGFVVLHRLKVLSPLEQGVAKLLQPVQSLLASGSLTVVKPFRTFTSGRALERDNQRLHREIARLLIEGEQLRLDRIEAAKVETAQRLLGERRWRGMVARIIGRAPDPTFRLEILNRGTEDGVRVGAAVVVDDGIYLGKIIEANRSTSKLLLLTDPHASAAAVVENEPRTPGLLSGEHGLSLRLGLLAKDDPLAPEQFVVTSGLDAGVPPGLVIGRIATVNRSPGDLFQSATVESAADLRNLMVVTVLLNTDA